jgi:hypothetical protein
VRARRLALVVALGAVVPLGVTVAAGPALALSCAAHPDGSPQAIASGTEQLAGGGRFFDQWDFAVIGTVTAIRTDERQGSPTYGATEIDIAVAGVLGVSEAPPTMTLRAGDPGWMVGWPFQRGAAYFVPVAAVGPDGQVNWTFGCDPVSDLTDAEATIDELSPLASAAGFVLSRPPADDGGGAGGGDGSSGGTAWFVPAVSAAAVFAAGTTGFLLFRRSPRRAGAGSA